MYNTKIDINNYTLHFWALTTEQDPCTDPPHIIYGDVTLASVRVATANGIYAVALNRQDDAQLLIFDSANPAKLAPTDPQGLLICWYQQATARLVVDNVTIVDMAYVLDGTLLLIATSAGELYAIPRSNPRSHYHMQQYDKGQLVHLVGNNNVLCIVWAVLGHSSVLQVLNVEREARDPFCQLNRLYFTYATPFEPPKPFLVGPYVIFENEEGEWVHVNYEQQGEQQQQIPLTFPNMAHGWQVETIISCIR